MQVDYWTPETLERDVDRSRLFEFLSPDEEKAARSTLSSVLFFGGISKCFHSAELVVHEYAKMCKTDQ